MPENRTEKIYRGTPGEGPKMGPQFGGRVWVIPADGQPYPLQHVVYHSPTGFSWGYGGSGPADGSASGSQSLALSILADQFGESPTENDLYHGRCACDDRLRCWQLYQAFKWRTSTVSSLTPLLNLPFGEAFELHQFQIASWLAEQTPRQPQLPMPVNCGLKSGINRKLKTAIHLSKCV